MATNDGKVVRLPARKRDDPALDLLSEMVHHDFVCASFDPQEQEYRIFVKGSSDSVHRILEALREEKIDA